MEQRYTAIQNELIGLVPQNRFSIAVLLYFRFNRNGINLCNTSTSIIMQSFFYQCDKHHRVYADINNAISLLEESGLIKISKKTTDYLQVLLLDDADYHEGYFNIWEKQFFDLLKFASKDGSSPITLLNVYCFILSHIYGRGHYCSCGIQTFAKELKLSPTTVQKYLDKLEEARLIRIKRGNRNTSNRYYKHVATMEDRQDIAETSLNEDDDTVLLTPEDRDSQETEESKIESPEPESERNLTPEEILLSALSEYNKKYMKGVIQHD